MSAVQAGARLCALDEALRIFRPGSRVRLAIAPPPIASTFSGILAAPIIHGPVEYVVLGVIREERLHGCLLQYRLLGMAGERVEDAANVIPALTTRELMESIPRAEGGIVTLSDFRSAESVPDESTALTWLKISPRFFRSSCGRFELMLRSDASIHFASGSVDVRDNWTHEVNTNMNGQLAAEAFCAARIKAVPLSWNKRDSRYEADGFCVHECPGEKFFASDYRFPDQHALRQSPWFYEAAQALRWCEVRAMCDVLGEAGSQRLQFQPIPF